MFELQRYAARGWDSVVQQWKQSIGGKYISPALLTKRDLHQKTTREKALGVLCCCLVHGDVFLINENDTISDDEIRFGDNDTLAAAVAVECAATRIFHSVKLVLLTNIDGLRADSNSAETLIRRVVDSAAVEPYAKMAANEHSCGGMITKVRAAKLATASGIETYIADGRINNAVQKALRGDIGTKFIVDQ